MRQFGINKSAPAIIMVASIKPIILVSRRKAIRFLQRFTSPSRRLLAVQNWFIDVTAQHLDLSKFVLRMRQQKASQLVVTGSQQYPGQKKSLSNLQRLMPALQLELA
jgi:hypothetical protein